MLALYKWIPTIHNWREAVFTGWFGPIGVGAIFYYTVALEALPEDGPNAHARALLEPVIYFMVLGSVIAHGITIPLYFLGTIATRTLTITSEKGNQVLRIPKMDTIIGRKQSPPTVIEETYGTDTPPSEDTIDRDVPRKHTAITILTPQVPEHVHSPSSLYRPNNTRTNSNEAVQVDDSDDESVSYLPISRRSSFSQRSKN